ncbi:MAG: NAD(P)H-hydrate dehydratase [Nitrospirota bacterium]
MKIVTAQQMRNIDQRAIKEFGIPGPVLMENAAASVMIEMERFFDGLAGVKVAIICGKGNNGGDGFALARRLAIRGIAVRVAILGPMNVIQGEADVHLSILKKTSVEIIPEVSQESLSELLSWSDIIVDAILGVGLSSPLEGFFAQTVNLINQSGKPVVAIDIPTGIHSDTGAVMGTAVKADLTVTMCLIKAGLALLPGADYAGAVRVADIGIPTEAIDQEPISLSLLNQGYAWGRIEPRKTGSHKGTFGHLFIVAGSPGKAGAAVMTSLSALRTGAGLVTAAVPNGILPIIQSQVFEAMGIPMPESMSGSLGTSSVNEILSSAEQMTACAIGPGLSTQEETVQVVLSLVQRLTIPMVVDADGLNALVGSLPILKKAKAPIILTPHPGEMARLLGISAADVQRDRIAIASEFAKTHKVILVLKGAGSIVATPDGQVFINSSGNPGMATGGTGDALTGIIGGLLAQGYHPTQAACLGVYVHGLAGDLAAKEKGEAGMIAGDLIEKIPDAFRTLEDTLSTNDR